MKLALLGATGWTGRQIAKLLTRLEINITLVGRDSQRLIALNNECGGRSSVVSLDIRFPTLTLDQLIQNHDVVISAAGPFLIESDSAFQACIKYGKIWVDISGEQYWVYRAAQQCQSLSDSMTATVIPSCAFESFISDIMLDTLERVHGPCHSVDVYYYPGIRLPSKGSLLSMKLANHLPAWRLKDRNLQQASLITTPVPGHGVWPEEHHAVAVPYPDVIFFRVGGKVQSATTWEIRNENLPNSERAGLVESDIRLEKITDEMDAIKASRRTRDRSPVISGDPFCILVLAQTVTGKQVYASLVGKDPYEITALTVYETVKSLLNRPIGRGFQLPRHVVNSDQLDHLFPGATYSMG